MQLICPVERAAFARPRRENLGVHFFRKVGGMTNYWLQFEGAIETAEAAQPDNGTTTVLLPFPGSTPIDDQLTLEIAAGDTVEVEGFIGIAYLTDPEFLSVPSPAFVLDGAGTLDLVGLNAFSGGVEITSGALELGSLAAAGSGPITFAGPDA
jgi:autotransporter-associated beta strand protein